MSKSHQHKPIDIGIQVDFSPTAKNHHFIDLGYDSLHSTPKQKLHQPEEEKDFQLQKTADQEVVSDDNKKATIVKRMTRLFGTWLGWRRKASKPPDQLLPVAVELDDRGEWDKKIDFLLSIIGFAVDLANVWRFPYLCYKNGGGVFLIPYTLMLIFGALPLFFLELSLGQFAKSGPISVWTKMFPVMKGVGYCSVLIAWYVSFFYNVIIGWTVYYIATTLISGEILPWQRCDNNWNTPQCFPVNTVFNCPNCTQISNSVNVSSAAQEFFERRLLQISKSPDLISLGSLRLDMISCVGFTFVLLYFSLFKGVKSSGKVVWVTATAPYIILTVLLIRGIFLPGAWIGIKYYLSPSLEKLTETTVWIEAAIQVFFSIGVGFGVHLTYASFNKFNNNCYRDALLTAMVNSCTSFYSGFVIFTYLGYMAQSMNKEIRTVAKEGYGLIFQVYPEAISTLPMARFWSLLFFLMLLTLGLDSAMGGLEAVITGIIDEWKLKNIKRESLTAIVLFSSFIGSLINCTEGGAYTMVWFDNYAAGISLLCSALFEAIAIVYCYGIDRFCCDIELMLGFKPNLFWRVCWKYISPIFLLCIIILSLINAEPLKYNDYVFPYWATSAGWIFAASSTFAIPIYAIIFYTMPRDSYGKSTVKSREVINSSLKSPIYV